MVMTAGEQAALRQDMATVAYNHRCQIKREAGKSTYDDPGEPTVYLTNQPCFYTQRRTEERSEVGVREVIVTELLLLPLTTDIRDTDLVTSVTDQSGAALITRARDIDAATRFASHIQIVLGSVR